jgi:hypothetical protein
MEGGGNRYAGLTSHSLVYLMEIEVRMRPSKGPPHPGTSKTEQLTLSHLKASQNSFAYTVPF